MTVPRRTQQCLQATACPGPTRRPRLIPRRTTVDHNPLRALTQRQPLPGLQRAGARWGPDTVMVRFLGAASLQVVTITLLRRLCAPAPA